MVSGAGRYALTFILAACPALAQDPQEQMFTDPGSCYRRLYTPGHLANHPRQQVTAMSIAPDVTSDALLGVHLTVMLRGTPGGAAEALAACGNAGGHSLSCSMEGDAGGFRITPAKNGAILIEVSQLGMGFETETGFVTLEADAGDDRSFLLTPVACR